MINERKVEMELDLQKLLQAYLHKWWLIVVSAIVCAALIGVYTINFITPMYRATITVYVNNVRNDQDIQYISGSNLAASQPLVNTYINIIKCDSVLSKVADASRAKIAPEDIKRIMSTAQVDDTELFNVTITHPEPKMAARIANAVAEVAPKEIESIVEGSSTKIIDYAKIPKSPSSPDLGKNCILGILAGALLALAYITVRFLLDVRIKDEEDLSMLFEMPVLAQIPAFVSPSAKRRNGYGKGKYIYHTHEYVRDEDEDSDDNKNKEAGK